MTLDDRPYTVIGVMPASFHFPRREVRVWTAMRFEAGDFEDRQNTFTAGMTIAILMTLAGTLAPALHAIHVDPMEAMRAE